MTAADAHQGQRDVRRLSATCSLIQVPSGCEPLLQFHYR